jgi:hypothetical protein
LADRQIAFLADIFLIFISKTGVFSSIDWTLHNTCGGWKRFSLVAAPIVLVVAIALWPSAPALRHLAEMAIDMLALRKPRLREVLGRRFLLEERQAEQRTARLSVLRCVLSVLRRVQRIGGPFSWSV